MTFKALAVASLTLLALGPAQARNSTLTLNDIGWLAGCWKAKPGENRVNNMEQWSKPFGNAMMGVGAELKAGQLTSWEHMKIESSKGSALKLVVRPHNKKEVEFSLTGTKAELLTFENEKNDFPQKITYRREKDGSLEIRIDGKVKSVHQAALFPMVRMPCE
ncbi:MAG: hypothetical protein JNM76_02190 [Betaproteobacteria bacterium]|nr:hypothetical protein [Betaproteobacteria bacterium]